jgi:hypothetical protein
VSRIQRLVRLAQSIAAALSTDGRGRAVHTAAETLYRESV